MYRNFVAWATQGPSVGPLTQFATDPVYKELIKYGKYYKGGHSDERLYVDLRRGRGYTNELEKVVRLVVVVGYHQGEYMYSMTNLGLLLSYKDYGVVAQNEMVALAA